MKLQVNTSLFFIIIIAGLFAFGCSKSSPTDTDGGKITPPPPPVVKVAEYAITNVSILPMTDETVIHDQTVIVGEKKILEIGHAPAVTIPDNVTIIDGTGKFLMPGLADMHTHLRPETDLVVVLANGITTVREMNGNLAKLEQRNAIEKGQILGPQMFVCTEITDGNPPSFSFANVITTVSQAQNYVAQSKADGYDFIKIYNNLTPSVYNAITNAATFNDIPVVGHVPIPVGFYSAISRRLNSMEHLLQYWDEIESPDSDIFGRTSVRRDYGNHAIDESKLVEIADATKESQIWVCPTAIIGDRYVPADEGAVLRNTLPGMRYMSPAIWAIWDPATNRHVGTFGDWTAAGQELGRINRRKLIKALHDAGVGLIAGTDANGVPYIEPGFSLLAELQIYIEAGLSPYETLKTATYNAAASLKALDSFGTVEEGKRADLLLLNANPFLSIDNVANRAGVMVNGRWMPESELQQMLEEIAVSYGR